MSSLAELEDDAAELRRRMAGRPELVRRPLRERLTQVEREIAEARRRAAVADPLAETWTESDE
jgi:hypothetical protein